MVFEEPWKVPDGTLVSVGTAEVSPQFSVCEEPSESELHRSAALFGKLGFADLNKAEPEM